MAAVSQPEEVTISINDLEVQVPKGELIVESVKRLGLEIPIFCYHPRMKPVGMCRMCLIEVGFKQPDGSVRMMPKPQTGCSLPASDGMVIFTDTERVHRDRKGVLEFLLINHPLDCPICDRGGECPLQNNTLFYGPSTSRFIEMKRHLPKAYPLSQYVTLDLERCIQCGRCVRFTEEISGDSQLAFRFRGASMQPSTFQLTDFESKFSGNTIEICPVGALTSTKYRFRARPWDLQSADAVCTVCANGCNVRFDYRGNKFVRISGRTNEAVNEEWTCDRGKFGHEFYNSDQRLSEVLVRDGDTYRPQEWSAAYDLILENFLGKSESVAGLCAPSLSNEATYFMGKLFRGAFQSDNVDSRWERHLLSVEDERALAAPTAIADLERAQNVVVFGTSLADTQPIVYLRLRKAALRHGTKVAAVTSGRTELDRFSAAHYHYGTQEVVEVARQLTVLAQEDNPSDDALGHVAKILRAEGTVLVASRSLLNEATGGEAIQALRTLCKTLDVPLNLYHESANGRGAVELGLLPGGLSDAARNRIANKFPDGFASGVGADTHQILERAASGQITALWIVGDAFAMHHDRQLVERALENVEFLVVQDIAESETSLYASVILPMNAPAEQDGTYTNIEGRVQRMNAIIPSPGVSKPAWRIFGECLLRAVSVDPLFNPREIMEEISDIYPNFRGCAYGELPAEGRLVGGFTATQAVPQN